MCIRDSYDAVPMKDIFPGLREATGKLGNVYARANLKDVTQHLEDVFDDDSMALMEVAFEKDPFFGRRMEDVGKGDMVRGAFLFGKSFSGHIAVVTAVMTNVIDNDGEFKPPPKTWEDMKAYQAAPK